jgi:MFS family permease
LRAIITQPPDAKKTPEPRATRIAALGLSQTLGWASSFYLPGVLALPIAAGTGLTPPWIYAALSFGLAVSAVLGPAVGRRIDRRGGRAVLCGSSLVFAGGLGLLALAHGPLALLLAWLVLGIAMAAGLYEPAFAAMTRRYGYEARGAITGITLLAGFASTVGWPLTAWLEHTLGWRGACAVWAALHLGIGLPLNAWALRGEVGSPRDVSTVRREAPNSPGAADRSLWLVSVLFTAAGMVTIGLATNLPRLFVAVGATPGAAIAAAALLGPAQVVARLAEYGARSVIDPLKSARIANALHPVAALTLGLGGAPAIAAFSLLHGAGAGMLTITRGTLPLALFGPEGYGARIGRINAPARIGQAIAPFLFGIAIDRIGGFALWISSALAATALLALARLELPKDA